MIRIVQKIAGVAFFLCFWASWTQAIEIITKTDISQGVVIRADFIKNADNAIILFDSSSSMKKFYKNSGKTRYEVAKASLKDRNEYLPDLGYNFGLYLYTPWKEIYPVQPYDRDKFARALETLPDKPAGPTLIREAFPKLESVLKKLQGRTAVFIYTDGYYSKGTGGKKPATLAGELARKYNVCFYLISTADDYHSTELFKKAETFNFCSRVIGFDEFVDREVYNAQALFSVKASKKIVTVTDKKIVGIKIKPILFAFDSIELTADAKGRLGMLADFLKKNPDAYAAMAGHTDSTGPYDYNMALSYRRGKTVGAYLVNYLDTDPSQIAMFWLGPDNPAADNDTPKGRALNRRVEIAIGGL